jgi:hypothetical protein
MAQTRGKTRNREQEQVRGRNRTEQMRADHDKMDDPEKQQVSPSYAGLGTLNEDTGVADETDGDGYLDESERQEAPSPGGPPEADAEGTSAPARAGEDRLALLEDVLGSRAPTALFRLERSGDTVRRRWLTPPPPAYAEALEELGRLVDHCFQRGRDRFTPEEWDCLLGTVPSPLENRLILLARLAVRGSEAITAPGGPAFKPNDRVLGRFARKFALLPDGLPFSLRLLLQDGRGKRPEATSTFPSFNRLPDAVQLQVLERAKQLEQAAGAAVEDDKFRDYLFQALQELRLPVEKPHYQHVTGLREKLRHHGLEHLFPNAKTRQESYARAPAAAADEEVL